MQTEYIETEIEKACKKRFYGLSNEDLIKRANNAADFNWDDEAVELNRRKRKSNGKFQYKMDYNTLVIISNNQ